MGQSTPANTKTIVFSLLATKGSMGFPFISAGIFSTATDVRPINRLVKEISEFIGGRMIEEDSLVESKRMIDEQNAKAGDRTGRGCV